MARVYTTLEQGLKCILCSREDKEEGERMLLLDCCLSGVHPACMEERCPDGRFGCTLCPKDHGRTRVTVQVIQRDKFSSTDLDNIEVSFLKYHVVSGAPMTPDEIQGLRIALNVRGYRAMRHVSHRIFLAALPFWLPLPKEKLCDWEDIVSRLSLGLIWKMVIEMRD